MPAEWARRPVQIRWQLKRPMYNFKDSFPPAFVYIHRVKYIFSRDIFCLPYFWAKIHGVIWQEMNCFSFELQIVLTGYEITNYENPDQSATWARILKQVSHILLVCYSALNPIAYCGELIYITMVSKLCCKKSATNDNLFLSERHLKTNHGKGPSFYQICMYTVSGSSLLKEFLLKKAPEEF